MRQPIYLDYAAATPVDTVVLRLMQPFFSEQFYNPSAHYGPARGARAALEDARASVASSLGARPSEITFTAGGTESANLAIAGVMQANPGKKLVVSAIEHAAVLEPAKQYNANVCPVDTHGIVDVAALESTIDDDTVLVSVMYANNEIGSVQPLADIVKIIKQVRDNRTERRIKTPLYIHTDAAQAPLYLDCNVARLGVDLMTLNGGKMYGPKQSGILYHHARVRLQPLIRGGGQELGVRSGTENVAFAVGFAASLQRAVNEHKQEARRISQLADSFCKRLIADYGAELHGHPKRRLPNNVHVSFPNTDNERILFALDDMGVYAASGSACQASSDEPSHVLRALGVDDATARSSIRFTIGRGTTENELEVVIGLLKTALTS